MHLSLRLLVPLVVGLVPALAVGRSHDEVELFRERSGKVIPPDQFHDIAPILVAIRCPARSAERTLRIILVDQPQQRFTQACANRHHLLRIFGRCVFARVSKDHGALAQEA